MTNYEWFIFAAILATMWLIARRVRIDRDRIEASNKKCIESNVAMTAEHRQMLQAIERNTQVGQDILEVQLAVASTRRGHASKGGSA